MTLLRHRIYWNLLYRMVALYWEIELLIPIKSGIILLLKGLLPSYHPKGIAKFKENTIGLLTEIAIKLKDFLTD